MNSNTIPTPTSASPKDLGDLEGDMGDVMILASIAHSQAENFIGRWFDAIRKGDGGAMVYVTEGDVENLLWLTGECAYRTRKCREAYYELLNASAPMPDNRNVGERQPVDARAAA